MQNVRLHACEGMVSFVLEFEVLIVPGPSGKNFDLSDTHYSG